MWKPTTIVPAAVISVCAFTAAMHCARAEPATDAALIVVEVADAQQTRDDGAQTRPSRFGIDRFGRTGSWDTQSGLVT